MKRLKFNNRREITTLLFIVVIFLSLNATAQDTIYLKSKEPVIIVKIIEVNPSNLKYKKYSNIDGPTYTIEKDKIAKVIYKNGEVERYTSESINNKRIERQTSLDLMPGSKFFFNIFFDRRRR